MTDPNLVIILDEMQQTNKDNNKGNKTTSNYWLFLWSASTPTETANNIIDRPLIVTVHLKMTHLQTVTDGMADFMSNFLIFWEV